MRVWYALADLYERAGDLPKARELFLRIRRHDAGFADAAERLAALGLSATAADTAACRRTAVAVTPVA